ncbi:MAG TPA: thiol reductant ABC exporter subunit CydD, partial [Acidithiobacillus sp.]|nr:thiol reductant ABC exporter subunit CydD [Acidithiobacillus sp.]
PLFILDEATANLDMENESLVLDAMQRLVQGRTAIVIAHRLATAERADYILVMDAGKVVEAGTHSELLATGGVYARLVAAYRGDHG